MIPHERTLVKRLEDQPFILLGINSDSEDRYRKGRVEKEVTWPSFFDGGSTGGPIASKWGVSGWPTIYVLDHQHRIRFKGPRGEAMDKAVDQLLAELNGDLPIPTTEEILKAEADKQAARKKAGTPNSVPAATKLPATRAKRALPLIPPPKKGGGV